MMIPAGKIACPTDFSEAALLGVQHATDLAKHFRAELCLVNIVPELPTLTNDAEWVLKAPDKRLLHAEAEQNLRNLATSIELNQGIRVGTIVGHGDPASEIVQIAPDECADMIVIATHGNTGWRHVAFGSVAERVVCLARCPVTFPAAEAGHAVAQAVTANRSSA